MQTCKRIGIVVLASLTIVACDSKDTVLHAPDGAAGQGSGGTGPVVSGGHPGTGGGGGSGLGGGGGATVSGTGGGGPAGAGGGSGVGGSGGKGGSGSGGSLGSGGAEKDGGLPDVVSDAPISVDAPVSDDGANCGAGYPVGSQKPQGDGCNTCYCEGGGNWLCTTRQCPPAAEAGAEVIGDAGQCPTGQRWCPGCTPETGACGIVCTGAPCPAPDAACTGSGCSAIDASATKDTLVSESGSTTCSQITTVAECDVRSDCHSVYRSLGACGCATAGCCMRFLSCASGGTATCVPPSSFGCTIPTPQCDSPYVLSYTPGCYEGCVKTTECGP